MRGLLVLLGIGVVATIAIVASHAAGGSGGGGSCTNVDIDARVKKNPSMMLAWIIRWKDKLTSPAADALTDLVRTAAPDCDWDDPDITVRGTDGVTRQWSDYLAMYPGRIADNPAMTALFGMVGGPVATAPFLLTR